MSNQNPTFVAYALCASVLILNQMILWLMSASVRGKSKTALNPEDLSSVAKNATLSEGDPPEVARVLRAHANGQANILQFLFLGALFVQLNGPALEAQILFGIFTAARVIYSIVYVGGKQPWRTVTFIIGIATTFVLLEEILRRVLL
jgi:uncharacterized MAPEG superfamily protein